MADLGAGRAQQAHSPADRSGDWATVALGRATDVAATLRPLRRGRRDRSTAVEPGTFWRATNTPDGPATTVIRYGAGLVSEVRVRAWGEGAAWAVGQLPALLGSTDPGGPARYGHPVVDGAARRLPGLRLTRSGAVVEALVPSIIEQKVTSLEAHRAYADLVSRLGRPAPGPGQATSRLRLMVPPTPAALTAAPTWVYHQCGLERKRADTIRTAAAEAETLERLTGIDPAEARVRLEALPGIGLWTSAEVAQVAWGDPDAVSVGDFHLPGLVVAALTGVTGGDDRLMLEALEPFRGQRGRVARYLATTAGRRPRRAPRHQIRSIANI